MGYGLSLLNSRIARRPHRGERARLPHLSADRLLWGAIATCAALLLALARSVEPDPRGLGTHLQLGLPRCAFYAFMHLPCPSCGLTTAFAHLVRFQLLAAAHANVVGIPLLLCVLVAVPGAACACWRGVPLAAALKRLRVGQVAAIIGLASVLSWLGRLAALC